MSLINKYWRVCADRWLPTIAEKVRSMRNTLKVWIRRRDVQIDYFVAQTVYVIEGSTCILSWSVRYAYKVQLSNGLGQYTQLQYSIMVQSTDLPERLLLTVFGRDGFIQVELFFIHVETNPKPVSALSLVSRELITLKAEEFVQIHPTPSPHLQISKLTFRQPTVRLTFEDEQITTLMHSIHTAEDLIN